MQSTPDILAAVPSSPAPVVSAPLLGVPLAITDYETTLDWVDAAVATRRRAYVCVAAVHTVIVPGGSTGKPA